MQEQECVAPAQIGLWKRQLSASAFPQPGTLPTAPGPRWDGDIMPTIAYEVSFDLKAWGREGSEWRCALPFSVQGLRCCCRYVRSQGGHGLFIHIKPPTHSPTQTCFKTTWSAPATPRAAAPSAGCIPVRGEAWRWQSP